MNDHATFHDLKGASVFITGGGSGIGAALTEGFVEQGAKVAFVQRSDASEFLDAVEGRHGSRPLAIKCDVSDIGALQAAITQASEANGPIGVLVSNAANDKRHTTAEVTVEEWDWNHSVNLRPYFFAAQAVIPAMRDMGVGSIVNVTSVSYMMGNAGYPAYTSANAGIMGLTRSLAREHGPDGIRVNALAPGWVLTDKQMRMWAKPDLLATHMDKQCLKEHLKEKDMVCPVLYLASKASRMMAGQVMAVDGGVVVTG